MHSFAMLTVNAHLLPYCDKPDHLLTQLCLLSEERTGELRAHNAPALRRFARQRCNS